MPERIRLNPTNKITILDKQKTYIRFYKNNLENLTPIIKNIEDIKNSVNDYIDLKIGERIEVFGEDDETDDEN